MAQLVLLLPHKEALTPDAWCSSHLRAVASHKGAGAIIMPTYEFLCEKCHKMFDVFWSLAEYDKRIKATHKCPACGSTRVVKTLSAVQVKTSKKS
jgi:putative FmdB family regulatory protein